MTETKYRMPAEWAPHTATWIAWPHNPEDWPGKFQPIPWVYCEIVRHLSGVEDVHILVNDVATEKRAYGMLRRQGANLARLHFHTWRTDRVWLRDSGPIFVKNPENTLAITDWKFNAWAKYPNHRNDDQIPQHVAELYDLPRTSRTSRSPTAPSTASSSKAAASTPTAPASSSPRKSACSAEVQQRNPGSLESPA